MSREINPLPCPSCEGSGWLADVESRTAVPCHCQRDGKSRRRAELAAIPKRYTHCTLANFHDRGNLSLSRARRRVSELVDCWPAIDRGLLLMGSCGVGKTHLAAAALQEIIRTSKPGRLQFSNFQEVVQEIHASFDPDQSMTKSGILQPLLDADLLVLDELGSQKPTSFVQDTLYSIINSRYNREKVTIFTSNYLDEPKVRGEERLEDRIGERLRSRLHEMAERIQLDSDDYRKNVAGRRV